MNCPVCGHALAQTQGGSIVVDVCKVGCGGIWFDAFELKKVDESHEPAGEILDDVERNAGIKVDSKLRRECPKCQKVVMMRHFFSVKREVEVDECPSCGGFWLDTGELLLIRKQFKGETERREAARKYFSSLFDKQLQKMRAESQENAARARRIAKILGVICPSYYIPGKQAGATF